MRKADSELIEFEDFSLDVAAAELRKSGVPVPLEPQVFDLIVYLARHHGRVVTRDQIIEAVWAGRIVSDSAISTRINAARKALGDDGTAQRIIKTVHGRGFRFEPNPNAPPPAQSEPRTATGERPSLDIRYCKAPDGVGLAYASVGEGPPVVRAASFLTHLQHDFDSVISRHWVEAFSRHFRYIRYDERGNGLSDWNVDDFSFEKMVVDLETVVAAMELERFALVGSSQGASVAIAYAHRHPEKVSCIVIYDGYAAGWRQSNDRSHRETRDALLELTRASWGKPNPVGRQAYTALFMPDGSERQHADFNRLQQITTTPENAYEILSAFSNIDVRDLLPQIRVPTLVLHRKDDAVVPFEAGRVIASSIPDARFVPLEGANHIVLEDEEAWPVLVNEVRAFVSAHTE